MYHCLIFIRYIRLHNRWHFVSVVFCLDKVWYQTIISALLKWKRWWTSLYTVYYRLQRVGDVRLGEGTGQLGGDGAEGSPAEEELLRVCVWEVLCLPGAGNWGQAEGRGSLPWWWNHVSTTVFLACHQCYCASSSLAWGLLFFFLSAFPSYIFGVHHFWVRFLRMWPFFNPTIKVVTFRLRGWCLLGVFLLPAFTRLGHERQDLLSPCDEMHVCTD